VSSSSSFVFLCADSPLSAIVSERGNAVSNELLDGGCFHVVMTMDE
jgi:hypothetical protein